MEHKKLLYEHTRDRTWNLLIRSQAPYPFGHTPIKIYSLSLILSCDHKIISSRVTRTTPTYKKLLNVNFRIGESNPGLLGESERS
ncbi:hypothetical protein K493DRAFT_343531 [Basidiobolus meristosporus CBS 931.73]|uniref:Uncharacterized protein n=1 Tax=Basidiobolus meristosporus CBS 931.73 TaxID=1314790 RepID=A0A1Y1VS62_9FUNG|nr:hypothetical protein K493DRAFT_365059 [Basidiobolus meristosporus CBS 931.73]ORX75503.1 hypothetical protein K493DRAFT_364096 [Basidiobolus meristosporus CBS 931.73]ORX75715.1 hypothetical protein K493DRAFT_364003 [Basidiobolus meristosporus CBS 931.73]ORX75908.1 hypothetical protein K493DRAFT_363933 [Basidiobolus meristosporus CBS 931.73]ORY08408.1 hypothetical protein K493DRAFT_343531 [Basidiobolus meristosporus CBS 931.73]|eukprot:ORX64013.1 hypothetical protein K493DRAFT_365059 [Basidiobolus meristosporus CBS 931.73]